MFPFLFGFLSKSSTLLEKVAVLGFSCSASSLDMESKVEAGMGGGEALVEFFANAMSSWEDNLLLRRRVYLFSFV